MPSVARRISVDELDGFSIDGKNRLYWQGQEVVTTARLPWLVNVAIVVTAVAAVAAALWPILRFAIWGT